MPVPGSFFTDNHMARSNSFPNIVILRPTDEQTRSRNSVGSNFGEKSLRKSIRKKFRNLFPHTSSSQNVTIRRSSYSSLGLDGYEESSRRGSSNSLVDSKV